MFRDPFVPQRTNNGSKSPFLCNLIFLCKMKFYRVELSLKTLHEQTNSLSFINKRKFSNLYRSWKSVNHPRDGIVPFHRTIEEKARREAKMGEFRTRSRCPSSFDILSPWTAQSMESGTSADRRILLAEEGGTPLKRPTTVAREEKKEGEEGTCARNISNAPSSVAKIRFQASIARARALLDERCRWPR